MATRSRDLALSISADTSNIRSSAGSSASAVAIS